MKLYEHQIVGAKWLAEHKRTAYLADWMGLGKTITAIAAVGRLGIQKVGVVCPASMVTVWMSEFEQWSSAPVHLGVQSYNMLLKNPNRLRELKPEVLIFDEAHYLKTLTAQRTKAGIKLANDLGVKTWFLSGTPTPNGPHEIYPIMQYALPKTLKRMGLASLWDWRCEFCTWYMADWGPQVTGAKNTERFKGLVLGSGFMLRRRFEDVELDLPPLDIRQMRFKIGKEPDIKEAEARVANSSLQTISEGELPQGDEHLSTLRRLLGAVKGTYTGNYLADELRDNDEKVVVFAYHREAITALEKKLRQFGLVMIDGSTPRKRRAQVVRKFQEDRNIRVFLGQIEACKEGLTLTASSEAIIVEPSWVPDYNQQAIHRIRRIGQTRDRVSARFVTLGGTLDDKIMGVLLRKQRTLANTID